MRRIILGILHLRQRDPNAKPYFILIPAKPPPPLPAMPNKITKFLHNVEHSLIDWLDKIANTYGSAAHEDQRGPIISSGYVPLPEDLLSGSNRKPTPEQLKTDYEIVATEEPVPGYRHIDDIVSGPHPDGNGKRHKKHHHPKKKTAKKYPK